MQHHILWIQYSLDQGESIEDADAHTRGCTHRNTHAHSHRVRFYMDPPPSPPPLKWHKCIWILCLKCACLALIAHQAAGPLQGKDKTHLLRWLSGSGRFFLTNRILLTINYANTLYHYGTSTLPFSGDHKLLFEYFNIKNLSLPAGEQSNISISIMGKPPHSLNLGFIYSALFPSTPHRKMQK